MVWTESFGEQSAATVPYYLAAAFDEIWVQPAGDVGFVGVSAASLFLADALDRAGVRRQIGTRHEYKNAANMFLERSFTDAQREATGRVVASVFDQMVKDVARDRHIATDEVLALVDRAPLPAAEALSAKLIDHIGYRDEVYADVRSRTSKDAQLLFAHRYHRAQPLLRRLDRVLNRAPAVVALVNGNGTIRLGRSASAPLPAPAMGADTVGAALRAAREDPRVKAVVFRVNSPGGSYVASDTLWREVTCLREAGKPVVVSMGDVAASGGYFVAVPAQAIVAQPGTLTGSIGVLGGKMSFGELLKRLGVGHDAVSEGRHARMVSALDEYSDEEFQQLSHWLDRVYDDFVARVAAGRSMSMEAVHEVAKGRVWTGADALERGLVDELGGIEKAAALARRAAGLKDDAELVKFPRASVAAQLRPPRSTEDRNAALAGTGTGAWGPLGAIAARLGLPSAGPLVMAPPVMGPPG